MKLRQRGAVAKWLLSASVKQRVDKLDQRQPQVLIEAALVELTTGDLDRFGVELGLLDLVDSNSNAEYNRGFSFTNFGQSAFQDTDDDGLPDTRLPDFDNPLQGITGGIISGDGFAVPLLINALSTDDKANILSLPSVLVNNNEAATVRTTESRPTQTQNQGTATTQSGVGTPRDAGITLDISPTISPNNYLRLNITIEVSRVVSPIAPCSAVSDRRRLSCARSIAPTAPRAPASVGVAMPAKMLPSTSRIRTSGGTMTSITRRNRAAPCSERASGGKAGAASGLTSATHATNAANMEANMIPGTRLPTNRSPTLIPSWSASTIRTTLGGMICPSVPLAAITPVLNHGA